MIQAYPSGHSRQEEVPGAYRPGSQSVHSIDPTFAATFPASHAVHVEVPAVAANVPSVQFSHAL